MPTNGLELFQNTKDGQANDSDASDVCVLSPSAGSSLFNKFMVTYKTNKSLSSGLLDHPTLHLFRLILSIGTRSTIAALQ